MKILDIYKNPLYTLYQWDVNQFVNVVGINPEMPVSVQFWRAGQTEAFVVESTVSGNTVTAAIPNELLREPGELVIYIWQDTGTGEQKGGRTETFFNIPIKERAQPSDYIYDDNVEYISVKTVIEDAKTATTAANEATEAATTAAKLATDTAEDIKQRADSGEFDGEKGDKGDKGDTGQTPDILINATINNTVGTPSVSIEKTGTLENPVFNLSFENLKGEQGQKGTDGKDGAPGAQGEPGQPGADGKSATITIGTVTTVSPNTPASVTNSGTLTDAVFNFEIPKGADGSGGADLDTLEKVAIKTFIDGNPAMSGSSAEWRVPLIEGYGQSTQVTTEGSNLLDPLAIKKGILTDVEGNVTAPGNYAEIYRTVFLNLPQGEYTFNIKSSTKTLFIIRNIKNNAIGQTPITVTEKGYTFTADTNGVFGISFRFSDNSEFTDEELYMLNTGSTSLAYEPYTGGAPSPSPDYPQEIKSSVMTGVKVMGKNLFNIEKSEFNNQGTFEITKNTALSYTVICEIQGGGVATISFDKIEIIEPNGGWSVVLGFFYADGTNYELYSHQMMSKNNQLSSDVSKSVKSIYVRNPWRVGQKIYGLQIEYGTTATPYEPYKEQSIPLSALITLRGIPSESGNITIDGTKYLSDYIGQKDGVYGVFRKIQEIVENGTKNWNINLLYSGFACKILNNVYYRTTGLCNQCIVSLRDDYKPKNGIWLGAGDNAVYVLNSDFYNPELPDSGLANWKAHLAENPLKIITVADEEVFEPLLEADQQALKDLKTFYPTSIISWETEDGGGAWTRAEIIHDPANYIEEKISSAVTQAITLAQGGTI